MRAKAGSVILPRRSVRPDSRAGDRVAAMAWGVVIGAVRGFGDMQTDGACWTMAAATAGAARQQLKALNRLRSTELIQYDGWRSRCATLRERDWVGPAQLS